MADTFRYGELGDLELDNINLPTDIIDDEEGRDGYVPNTSEQEREGDVLSIDLFNFEIISNIDNSEIFVDNELYSTKTPTIIPIKKSDLFLKDIQKSIEVRKEGYVSRERYDIYLVSKNSVPLNEQTLLKDGDDYLGLSNLDIRVNYYINDQLQNFNTDNGNLVTLNFNLTKVSSKESNKRFFTINLTGKNESVILERVRDMKTFPLNNNQVFEDNLGEKFIVRSIDSQIYRLARLDLLTFDNDGNIETPEIIEANDGQSIKSEIILNQDHTLNLYTQKLVYVKQKNPRIKSYSTKPIIHNINGKSDVPLAIQKNSDVTDVSVIVGDEVFEFNNLKPGPVAGIKIPKWVFDRVGNYNMKVIPYSLKELKEREVNS